MKKFSLIKLYFIFVKVGAILLGGGYVILPILNSELCEKRDLIKENELTDYFALSQSLPGMIATNISIFTGYKIRGALGAITAMLGTVTAPVISIIILASFLECIAGNSYITGTFRGIGVAVTALIFLTTREIWQKSNRDGFFYFILAVALVGLLYIKASPAVVIVFCSMLGVLIKRIKLYRRID